jgi:hypothetical protein
MLLAALAVSASGVFAQGTITFANTTGSYVVWGEGGLLAPNTRIPGTNGIKVGLYYNDQLVPNSAIPVGVRLSDGTMPAGLNGRFIGPAVTVPNLTAGTPGNGFVVKAWSGNFDSYEAAIASGQFVYTGLSSPFSNPTGGAIDPATGSPGLPADLTGFAALGQFTVVGIPEPSTIALAALGLGGLLALRRRK